MRKVLKLQKNKLLMILKIKKLLIKRKAIK